MHGSIPPKTKEIIKILETLPEAKVIAVLLLIAEQAQKKLIQDTPKVAEGATVYIGLCWDWLANPQTPLERINQDYHMADPYDLLLVGTNPNTFYGETLKAHNICVTVIGYVTNKSFEKVGRLGDVSEEVNICSMREFMFFGNPGVDLEDHLTPEILSFLGLDGQASL